VQRHQKGEAGWTHSRGHWELVYYETFTDRKVLQAGFYYVKLGLILHNHQEIIRTYGRLNFHA
jgi:predicted GIY-YIG superfamily endonuclease